MKITIVLKHTISNALPIYSTSLILADLGHEVTFICDACTDVQLAELTRRKVSVVQLHSARKTFLKGPAEKLLRWHQFKVTAWKAIEENRGDVYWFGSADTVLALGKRVLGLPYVFHARELEDSRPLYRYTMGEYLRRARLVITPEETRAHVMRVWYGLSRTPMVLPNKPYYHPRKRRMPISDVRAAEAFAKIPKDSKVVLYQGNVTDERNLMPIAKLIEDIGHPWVLAIQTQDVFLERPCYQALKAGCKFYPIPFVNVPHHLEVTSNADLGLVSYAHMYLNTEFCAPNKIWEYSGFGVPMLANDVKGLKDTVGRFDAGVCLNMDSIDVPAFKDAFARLLAGYDRYSVNATRLFESVDMVELVRQCVDTLDLG